MGKKLWVLSKRKMKQLNPPITDIGMSIGSCSPEPAKSKPESANPKSEPAHSRACCRLDLTVSELQYIYHHYTRHYIRLYDHLRYIDRYDLYICNHCIDVFAPKYWGLRTKLGFLKQNPDIEDFDLYAELIFLQFNCLCRGEKKNIIINIILQKVESVYFPWEQLRDINTWRRTYRSSNGGRLCLRLLLRLLRLLILTIRCAKLLGSLCKLVFMLPCQLILGFVCFFWATIAIVLSNKIQREYLVVGDHIYTWRRAHIYAHHG